MPTRVVIECQDECFILHSHKADARSKLIAKCSGMICTNEVEVSRCHASRLASIGRLNILTSFLPRLRSTGRCCKNWSETSSSGTKEVLVHSWSHQPVASNNKKSLTDRISRRRQVLLQAYQEVQQSLNFTRSQVLQRMTACFLQQLSCRKLALARRNNAESLKEVHR
jgi:hypothetical protein